MLFGAKTSEDKFTNSDTHHYEIDKTHDKDRNKQ